VGDECRGDGEELLYQIICLQGTPPVRQEEQDLCMRTRKVCWRLESHNGAAACGAEGKPAGAAS
jgi:hypothetical protein